MPRGLGDDPLSRQRRGNRSGKRTTEQALSSSPITVDSSHDLPSGQTLIQPQTVAEISSSSPLSPSYNDVFFQRRAESGAGSDYVETHDVIAEPAIEESTASVTTMEEPVVSETTAMSTIAATPIVPTPVALADTPKSQENREAAIVDSEGFLDERNFEPQSDAQTGQTEAQGAGFFQRIFGRFRK